MVYIVYNIFSVKLKDGKYANEYLILTQSTHYISHAGMNILVWFTCSVARGFFGHPLLCCTYFSSKKTEKLSDHAQVFVSLGVD